MPNSISAAGLQTATQSELLAQQTAAFQAIYGPNINIASNTPDGQNINITIQTALDLENLIMQINSQFDPDQAIGAILDQRCSINGIQRQAATFSTTNITVVTSQVVNLYALDQTVQSVFTVADAAGNQWQLITSQLGLSSGTHILLFQAANPGAVFTTINTITIPVSIVLGVTSVNNPSGQVYVGINEESDFLLQTRRAKSVSLPSQGYFQSLEAALENIPGVTSAYIIENDSGGLQTSTGNVPGHSIWVIIAGSPNIPLTSAYNSTTTYTYGQIASFGGVNYISVSNSNTGHTPPSTGFWNVYSPIPQAIYIYRNAGCGIYNSGDSGANTYIIGQIDGTSFPIYWDTVVGVNLFIKMTLGSINGVNTPNIAAITSFIAANFIPGVNQTININQISAQVLIADPNTLTTFVSGQGLASPSVGGTYANTAVPVAQNNQFSISATNIICLPIALNCPNGTPTFSSSLQNGLTVSIVHGNTIQFNGAGGFGSLTYSVVTSTGSTINSSTGLYTAGTAGTDTVTVTDTQSHTQTSTVTVT